MYRLRIKDRRSVAIFLRATMPYLRVKKVMAQDHLRYFAIFPKTPWANNAPYVPPWVLSADIRAGLNQRQIGEKHGISTRNINRRLRKIEKRKAA